LLACWIVLCHARVNYKAAFVQLQLPVMASATAYKDLHLFCQQVTYQQQQKLLKAQQQAAEADARMAEQMDLVMQASGQCRTC
jgi:hypothetical protein